MPSTYARGAPSLAGVPRQPSAPAAAGAGRADQVAVCAAAGTEAERRARVGSPDAGHHRRGRQGDHHTSGRTASAGLTARRES